MKRLLSLAAAARGRPAAGPRSRKRKLPPRRPRFRARSTARQHDVGRRRRAAEPVAALLLVMGLLTILPSLILMMTSFTRILVVLGDPAPGARAAADAAEPVLIGLSLFLSLFVMAPTLERVNEQAIAPYSGGHDRRRAGDRRRRQGIPRVHDPPDAQDRPGDVRRHGQGVQVQVGREVPFSILLPAFVTSELKTAFQIGFMLFLPFLVIDLVVSSVLMSLGMMMMSPDTGLACRSSCCCSSSSMGGRS
jgi:flagellar biosynthesis protein FliP